MFELEPLSTLMPLFRAELGRPWFHHVVASDASPYGFGVCHRSLDLGIVGDIGRTIEARRYQDDVIAAARLHALGDGDVGANVGTDEPASIWYDDDEELAPPSAEALVADSREEATVPWAIAHSFAKVPGTILRDENWLVVPSREVQEHLAERSPSMALGSETLGA